MNNEKALPALADAPQPHQGALATNLEFSPVVRSDDDRIVIAVPVILDTSVVEDIVAETGVSVATPGEVGCLEEVSVLVDGLSSVFAGDP